MFFDRIMKCLSDFCLHCGHFELICASNVGVKRPTFTASNNSAVWVLSGLIRYSFVESVVIASVFLAVI